ncbi:MAG TPA: hypothetical protein VK943_01010 [Arenibaculum sp.]|nr:hypothetical protein [Arenibaculum sp.]
MSYEQVEQAWDLSDAAREHARAAGRALGPEDYWAEVFRTNALVDVERTEHEGGTPPTRIFLKSPYGLQWRDEHADWIPFRHGEIPPFTG